MLFKPYLALNVVIIFFSESNVDGNLIENSANGSSIISNALASENSPPISLQKANEKNIGPEAEHVKSKPAVYLSQKALRQGTRLLKSPQTLEEMSDKIFHLYKCMGYACSYTTNSAEEFRDHFGKHLDERTQEIGFNKCAYCLEVFEDGKLLVEHILNIHSHCPFLCGYCFYRALDKRHVTIHQVSCSIFICLDFLYCIVIQLYFTNLFVIDNVPLW